MSYRAATSFAVALLLLSACAAQVPAPVSTGKSAPNDKAASRAFIDPVTGELRAPTAAELAAASAAATGGDQTGKSVKAVAPPEEITLPGGETMVRYGDSARVEERVCIQENESCSTPDQGQQAVIGGKAGSKGCGSAWYALLLLHVGAASAANFSFINMDGADEGLSDTAAFTPIGGNNATTLGQARMNVLQEAGRVWGLQLASSVTIVVEAKFDPLTCSANTGTLGSAGAKFGFADFPAAPLPNVFYAAALADALSGTNRNGVNDIDATFSSALDGSGGCLNGRTFYLGLNHQPGNNIDLLAVVLHELGHGLGFASVVKSDGTSTLNSGRLSAFDQLIYSDALGAFFPAMMPSQRQTAITSNNGTLVWNGVAVNGQTGVLTGGVSNGGHLKIYAPATYSDGSSTSHWDTSAQWSVGGSLRSLLMEPFITANPLGLTDVTGCALRDMGWTGTRCPDSSATPVAQSQSANATEDTPRQITLLGTDGSGNALTYAIVAQPARGTLTAPASLSSANGVVFTYTPAANLNGLDSFTFQVSNAVNVSSEATVTINVAAVNDPPVANAPVVTRRGHR